MLKSLVLLAVIALSTSFSVARAGGGADGPGNGWMMYQRWDNLAFIHWEVEPEELERLIPRPLKLETREGKAYLGIVAFRMTSGRPAYLPLPLYRPFGQVNLRTYVTYKGKRGVYFFTLDADNWLGSLVADKLFALPYVNADVSFNKRGKRFSVEVKRERSRRYPKARFDITYKPTSGPVPYRRDSLEIWLTDLVRYFQVDDEGCVITSELWHPPFVLQKAKARIGSNDLGNQFDLQGMEGDSHVLYSPGTDTYFWPPKKLGCR